MSGTSPVKTVVLFGKTGDGKSTVANMLSSGDLDGEFAAGNSLGSVTKKTVVGSSPELNWCIIDTEGMFSSENPEDDQKRAEELRCFLTRNHPVIDMFCYVKKASRFTRADEWCWKAFLTLLPGTDYHDNILLVFTSCSEGPEWVVQYQGILEQHMAGPRPYQKVAVDFPPSSANPEVESELKDVRKTSLDRLIEAVKSSRAKEPLRLHEHQSSPSRENEEENRPSAIRKAANPCTSFARMYLKLFTG